VFKISLADTRSQRRLSSKDPHGTWVAGPEIAFEFE